MGNYKVQQGDCLWTIVQKKLGKNTSNEEINKKIKQIAETNNISNPSLIYTNQTLDLSCFEGKSNENIWDKVAKYYEDKSTKEIEDSLAQYTDEQGSTTILSDKITSTSAAALNFDEKMSSRQKNELQLFEQHFKKYKKKYEQVEKMTGVPAELIAAIHWREGSGNFDTYLHNGEKLGQVTTLVPKGIYFEDWTEAAAHAINTHNPGIVKSNDINTWYEFAERYNGLGYRNKGKPSPYVWAGTDNYSSGKYVADGKYDPNYVDQQLGVALMVKSLLA